MLLDRWLAFMRPFRLAVCQKLLEHRKANLAVIQCVAEIAAFVNPSRRNPTQRQTSKLFNLVFAATWTGISENCHVRLRGDPEFVQQRAAVLAIIPYRDETKLHLWIFIDHFCPAAGFELGLAVGTPRRPEVNDGGLRRFDCVPELLLGRGLCVHRASEKQGQDQQTQSRHSAPEYG